MRTKHSDLFSPVFLMAHFSLSNYRHAVVNQKNAATVEGQDDASRTTGSAAYEQCDVRSLRLT